MTPELTAKIAMWRYKAAQGTLTKEEELEAVAALRSGRVGAAVASERSRTAKAKVAIPDANDLLDEIGGL